MMEILRNALGHLSALALAAAFVAGLARGFSGFGAALIFMPMASASLGAFLAAPMLLLMDSLPSLALLPASWRRAHRGEVGIMVGGVLLGGPIGAYALSVMPPIAIRWAIVGVVLALLCLLISGWRYRGPATRPLSFGVGAASGLLGGAAMVGGPPVVAYWLGRALAPETVRANLNLFFIGSSAIAAVSYSVAGALSRTALIHAVIACPIYALGAFVGSKLFWLASPAFFRRICYLLVATSAVLGMPVLDPFLR
jgi:uncharacterized membrane protein YfcA